MVNLAEVRWDDLFADLEVEAAGLAERERDLEIAERTRAELATVAVADRFRAAVGLLVSVRVTGADVLRGHVRRVTPQWLLLASAGDVEWLVAWPALMGATGVPAHAVDPAPSPIEAGLGWPATWRVLARDRAPVYVVRRDGTRVTGVPSRVGKDFVEVLASGPDLPDAPRYAQATTELLAYDAVAAVRLPRADD